MNSKESKETIESKFKKYFENLIINFNKNYNNEKLKKIFIYNNVFTMYKYNDVFTKYYNILNINNLFDKIFVLNLDKRIDRWTNIIKQFEYYDIYNFERYSAIDGSTKEISSKFKKIQNENKSSSIYNVNMKMSGSYAILLSTINILKIARERKYKSIIIFQDDILFIKNFQNKFNEFINSINLNTYKLIYFSAQQHVWNNIDINKYLNYYHPTGDSCGACAIAFNSSIFDEMIELMEKYYYTPIDEGALKIIQKKYSNECYISYPNIIIADLQSSDLRGPRNNNNRLFKWNSNLYNKMEYYL